MNLFRFPERKYLAGLSVEFFIKNFLRVYAEAACTDDKRNVLPAVELPMRRGGNGVPRCYFHI